MSEIRVVDSGNPESRKHRRWLWTIVIILGLLILSVGGFVIWAINPLVQIDDLAYDVLESSETITVTDRAWLAFLPNTPPQTGLILYPSARVPGVAFAPLARRIASEGYLVVVVYPPINLALLNPNLATPVTNHFSAVENWVVGGHSLGGSVAAAYASNHLDLVGGLVLMGAYPGDDALAATDLQVTSIYGTEDGLVSLDEIEASRANLPPDTTFISIAGGNHAQFAYYGKQGGDNPATISQEEQIQQTIRATLDLLARVGN